MDATDSNLHPNPTEDDTFPEIQNPSDTENPIVTDSKFLFWFNCTIIFVYNK